MGYAVQGPLVLEVRGMPTCAGIPDWQIFLSFGNLTFHRAMAIPVNVPVGLEHRIKRISWDDWTVRKGEVDLPLPIIMDCD